MILSSTKLYNIGIYLFVFSLRHNLPESPPDSEPPYSPADGIGQSPRKSITILY